MQSESKAAGETTAPELVELTIDDKVVQVPAGINLIEAARVAGSDIPYYCYHPHLSVPGNCRMCQVEVEGQPKLTIGCNTQVKGGMKVRTQVTSKKVEDTQAATLEFILINHPLDCTVCDQAGHCKLQDYHYEYNARPSRFLEDKVHKAKAKPLGPTVMLDAERCILCTRCVRFCDEVAGTSELGMFNRGDRSEIGIFEGRELTNALSGTVVDLCPVGALTHKKWRFNTRIWFTKETDSICPGCSTGCNVKVAVRDQEVVQVKARLNSAVNKEWLCDEGRYGFQRFLPKDRITSHSVRGADVSLAQATQAAGSLREGETLVLLSPDLLLEEYALTQAFLDGYLSRYHAALQFRSRPLDKVEQLLVSPDYAANFRGAQMIGLVKGASDDEIEQHYDSALDKLKRGMFQNVVLVGDRALGVVEQKDEQLMAAISAIKLSVGILADANNPVVERLTVVFPEKTILEKSGLLVNRSGRVQYSERVIDAPAGAEPAGRLSITLQSRLVKR